MGLPVYYCSKHLILQRRLAVSRLLAPHERSADVCLGPTIPCGASNRNRQTRRCNIRMVRGELDPDPVTVQFVPLRDAEVGPEGVDLGALLEAVGVDAAGNGV